MSQPEPTVIDESELDLSADEIAELLSSTEPMQQGSAEWFAERLGKVTASRVKDAVTGTKYKQDQYMYELVVHRLTGSEKRFSSKYTDWGINTEEEAAGVYAEITGRELAETGFHEHPTLAAGASPDRLVDDDGLLQVKCPNSDTHLKYLLSDQIPPEYYDQMMWEIRCANKQWNDFMSYDPAFEEIGLSVFIKRLERDQEYIDKMEAKVTAFLARVDETERKLRNYRNDSDR